MCAYITRLAASSRRTNRSRCLCDPVFGMRHDMYVALFLGVCSVGHIFRLGKSLVWAQEAGGVVAEFREGLKVLSYGTRWWGSAL